MLGLGLGGDGIRAVGGEGDLKRQGAKAGALLPPGLAGEEGASGGGEGEEPAAHELCR